MKRLAFVAALGAVAVVAASAAPCSAVPAALADADAPLSLWEFGGCPTVIARTAEDARRIAVADEIADDEDPEDVADVRATYESAVPRRLPQDESFTMFYDDPEAIEDGLTQDAPKAGRCGGCGGRGSGECCITVTMSCGEWASFLGEGYVIHEFQG